MAAPRPGPTSSEMVAALAGCGMAAAEMRRRRRRRRVGRAMHELRRPLQALLLNRHQAEQAVTALDLALAALRDLESVLDGDERLRAGAQHASTVSWPRLLSDAADRWREAAWLRGGRIRTRCLIDGGKELPEATAITLSQALDNLILNALIHGGASVEIAVSARASALQLSVTDSGAPPSPRPRRRAGGEGQGLKVVAEIAARLGGSFRLIREAGKCRAVIELPRSGQLAP